MTDSLLIIGQVPMGEPAFLSEEFSSSSAPEPDIELVTTALMIPRMLLSLNIPLMTMTLSMRVTCTILMRPLPW